MKDQNKIQQLRDKCVFFINYLISNNLIPKESIESYLESIKLLESAFDSGNIKPLLSASADIDDQINRHLPFEIAIELKKLFREKLNIKYNIINKNRIREIQKIIKKGYISNNIEYDLIINRIDEIYEDTDKIDEINTLNNLLYEYQKSEK